MPINLIENLDKQELKYTMQKPTNLKKSTIAYAFLLATSPAWANGKTGGGTQPSGGESSPPPQPPTSPPKSGIGKTSPKPPAPPAKQATPSSTKINFTKVQVEQAKNNKVKDCKVPANVRLRQPNPHHVTSLAFDSDKKRVVTLQFNMTKVAATKDEQILVLLSSRCLTSKSQLKLKKSAYKLALDFKDIKQLGTFNVPAQPMKLGNTAITFDVPLDTEKLAEQVKAGNETFYFQVGLLKKADFNARHYSDMILSPMEAVHFTPKACPNKKQYRKQIRSTNTSCRKLRGKSK